MKNIFLIGILIFSLSSCSSFLEEYSQELAKVESISDLDELLRGSVYLPYSRMYINEYSYLTMDGKPFFEFIHFMSDELHHNENTTSSSDHYGDELFGYYTWQRSVGVSVKGDKVRAEDASWDLAYEYINVANMVIAELEELEATNDDDAADKLRIEGEARFLRALYYFTLVNVYADPYVASKAETTPGVPLKITSYIEDKEYSRNSVKDVYDQIIKDLSRAEECLKDVPGKSLYRADITAVYLLKSRVYLYMQEYKHARTYAQYVLDKKDALLDLKMFSGSDNVLTSSNEECIFSMGGNFLSAYIYGNDRYVDETPFIISDDLLAAYDDDDLRKSKYIQNKGDFYTYTKAYWVRAHYGTASSVSDNYLFRTSEAYLNLAEAAAFDNDENTARQMIALLQAKRYTTAPAVSESGNALIDLIRTERQRELCLEGHRWFDLRRYQVCGKYPWSKTYSHTYYENDYAGDPRSVQTFKLLGRPDTEEYDKGYTLAFPKEVMEYQSTLTTNERPERQPVYHENFED